jgi:hypothetical protein
MKDFAELSAFTENYLNSNFTSIFSGTDTVFVISTTNITGSEFRLGQPVRVDYNTTMTFGFQSSNVPDLNTLNALLAGTFEGSNGEAYATAISTGLETSNIFSTTTAVSFQEAPPESNENSITKTAISVVTILAVFAFVSTAAIYRRQDYEKIGKESILTDTSSTEGENSDDDTADSDSANLSTMYRFNGEALIVQESEFWEIANKNAADPIGLLEAKSESNDRIENVISEGGDKTETTSSSKNQKHIIYNINRQKSTNKVLFAAIFRVVFSPD